MAFPDERNVFTAAQGGSQSRGCYGNLGSVVNAGRGDITVPGAAKIALGSETRVALPVGMTLRHVSRSDIGLVMNRTHHAHVPLKRAVSIWESSR